MTQAPPELSVMVLTFNEADALGPFLARLGPALAALGVSHEVVVLDGGSTDGTVAIAERAGARVVRQKGPGYGNAYREGLAACRGRRILNMDADLAHPPEDIARLWARRDDADVVAGSRYLPGSRDCRPAGRRLLSVVLNHAYAWVLASPITDTSGGFRLYRADQIRGILGLSRGPYYDVVAEILVLLWGRGATVLELPYVYADRVKGGSKARIVTFGLRYFTTLLRLRGWLWAGARPQPAPPGASA